MPTKRRWRSFPRLCEQAEALYRLAGQAEKLGQTAVAGRLVVAAGQAQWPRGRHHSPSQTEHEQAAAAA